MQRNTTIDVAKGIGILLMLLGHCNGIPHIIRNAIFSFHMPLFFIFSGYFYSPKEFKSLVKSGFRHLVLPYVATSLAYILLCVLAQNYELARQKVIGTIMSNGGWRSEIFGSNLPYIGPIWFLLALFWCKIFYFALKAKFANCLLPSFIISTIALIIGKYILNLPFGILTALCGLVFYAMGDTWRNWNGKLRETMLKHKRTILCIGFLLWAFCIRYSHLELATFDCRHYPLSMAAAFIGTYITYTVADHLSDCIQSVLREFGKNSLLILCYHTLCWPIWAIINNILHFKLTAITSALMIFVLSLGLAYLHIALRLLASKLSAAKQD